MKKFSYILISIVMASTALVSCGDLLDVDSKRLTTDQEYGLNTPSDSIYSMFGLFTQLQKLADSYVLLGELRGDLLDITDNSSAELREISNLEISKTNSYANIKNYYAVVNNCNYILNHLDTNVVSQGSKLKLRQFAAVKAIRAWTYMQVALNFKTAKYYTDPILTVADAEKTYPEYEISELVDILIADLEPVKAADLPNLGYIDSYNTSFSMFPVRFVLGDLYLWKASLTNNKVYYEKAATEYRELMYKNRIVINKDNTSYWVAVNNTISSNAYVNWINAFSLNSGEVITTLASPTEYGQRFELDSLNMQQKIVPSLLSLKNWEKQTYYLNEASNAQGDLRKYGSLWWKSTYTSNSDATEYTEEETRNLYIILKYLLYKQNVIVYRSSLLYLRYAEAVNRLGKPNLAFAVMKYGLNATNMINTKIVPAKEKESPLPTYMSFSDSRFNNNVGVRMRGLGNVDKDTTFFALKRQNSQVDSILYVENLIEQELVLETAYEGNRFHDLMRIALRRIQTNEGTSAYLADKVAEKHSTNKEAIRTKLLTIDNWYIQK